MANFFSWAQRRATTAASAARASCANWHRWPSLARRRHVRASMCARTSRCAAWSSPKRRPEWNPCWQNPWGSAAAARCRTREQPIPTSTSSTGCLSSKFTAAHAKRLEDGKQTWPGYFESSRCHYACFGTMMSVQAMATTPAICCAGSIASASAAVGRQL